jgi:three-Cys-motif partner protein
MYLEIVINYPYMAKKDLFKKPFDEGTIDKLEIFEDYFKEWLPVFLARPQPIWNEIQIFDLFGGEGKDITGILGSPLRILKILNHNEELIIKSGVKIRVIISEYDKEKYDLLVPGLESIVNRSLYELVYYNKDFALVFDLYYNSMKKTANFLFLDQSGIKQITENIFSKLIDLQITDFLFFISSSFIKRFGEVEEFKRYLKITKQELEDKSYYHIHRIVLNYYRSLIPSDKKYFLAPFSIRKTSGIYGLIFGSNHTYGMEKFLSVCWKHDALTGEANFDIDNEKINLASPALFPDMNVPSKRQLFEENLKNKILNNSLTNNISVYLQSLNEGFLLKDANAVLKDLRDNKKISYDFKLITSKLHKEISLPIKLL